MNDGSAPEGAGPERRCGDLGTCQSPMPCEMPVWVGTVPSGCTPPPGYMPGPRGGGGCSAAEVGRNLNQGPEGKGRQHTVHIFPLKLRINITNGRREKAAHYSGIIDTCGHDTLKT